MKKWIILLVAVLGLSSLASSQTYSIAGGLEIWVPRVTSIGCGGTKTETVFAVDVLLNVSDMVRLGSVGLDSRFGLTLGILSSSINNPCPCSGWFCGFNFPILPYLSCEAELFVTLNLDSLIIYAGPGVNLIYFTPEWTVFSAVVGVRFQLEPKSSLYVEGQLYFNPPFAKSQSPLGGVLFNAGLLFNF